MEKEILEIISSSLGVDESVLTMDLSIGDIPEWNSIGNLAMIAALEEKLDIEIPMEDLFELTDIRSIISEVKKLKADA
jgi:acyl carrier protein